LEYDDEELEEPEPVDEDGQPLRSEQEIRDIINSIHSFKFEQSALTQQLITSSISSSSRKKKQKEIEDNTVTCSVCLDALKTGV